MARVLAWACGTVLVSACGGRALTSTDSSAGNAGLGVARGGATAQGGASGVAAAPSFAGASPTGGASSSSGGVSSAGAPDVGPGVVADHPRAQVKFDDCTFSPRATAVGPFASPAAVRGRIEQFINVLPLMRPGLPTETTPSWAATQMAELIDANAAVQKAGDGLTDFFQIWTTVSDGLPGSLDGWHPFARDWAYFSELDDFTLADLFGGTTSDQPHRVGIFTDPTFVSQKPRSAQRGVALASALFSEQIPPPPPGISLVPPIPGNGTTFRQAYTAEVSSPLCASCHVQMDPLGFALEHFDSNGSYRDLDNGQPIDSTGTVKTPESWIWAFDGIEPLTEQASASCEVARYFAEAELAYALRVNGMLAVDQALPQDSPDVNQIAQQFADSGRNLRTLAVAIAQSSFFLK